MRAMGYGWVNQTIVKGTAQVCILTAVVHLPQYSTTCFDRINCFRLVRVSARIPFLFPFQVSTPPCLFIAWYLRATHVARNLNTVRV